MAQPLELLQVKSSLMQSLLLTHGAVMYIFDATKLKCLATSATPGTVRRPLGPPTCGTLSNMTCNGKPELHYTSLPRPSVTCQGTCYTVICSAPAM